ncbi:MAG: glycosyltransferase [Verrucomicrobiales bacterium]|nr:glycosyltransferase [Verrucomicrobiales bacterium]
MHVSLAGPCAREVTGTKSRPAEDASALPSTPAPPPLRALPSVGGRTGWPWDVPLENPPDATAAAVRPGIGPDSASPAENEVSISLVLVSYNQAAYLEESIRSVLLQDPPPSELFIIDGGSTDGSVEIIRKYAPWLTGWVSERDRGQSDAINKGFARCTGEVVNWLCSDDFLLPGALRAVQGAFRDGAAGSEGGVDVVAGNARYHHEDGRTPDFSTCVDARAVRRLPTVNLLLQPSCFFRRRLLGRSPRVREDLHYTMDLELWTWLKVGGAKWAFLPQDLSVYRVTGQNKSVKGWRETMRELRRVYGEYERPWIPLWWWFSLCWLPAAKWRHGSRTWVTRALSRRVVAWLERGLRLFYDREHVAGFAISYHWYALGPWVMARRAREQAEEPR